MHDLAELHRPQLVLGVAEDAFPGGVQIKEASIEGRGAEQIERALEKVTAMGRSRDHRLPSLHVTRATERRL
jgi:hypothetical protein